MLQLLAIGKQRWSCALVQLHCARSFVLDCKSSSRKHLARLEKAQDYI